MQSIITDTDLIVDSVGNANGMGSSSTAAFARFSKQMSAGGISVEKIKLAVPAIVADTYVLIGPDGNPVRMPSKASKAEASTVTYTASTATTGTTTPVPHCLLSSLPEFPYSPSSMPSWVCSGLSDRRVPQGTICQVSCPLGKSLSSSDPSEIAAVCMSDSSFSLKEVNLSCMTAAAEDEGISIVWIV